ncbi:MAG: DUF2840 domain-containing protein [Mesorhizobium sp.]|nr:DUF2840 domain-containing protein [Mesorhizobium sp. M5C.F.Ca.IN.020.32.2.1]RUV86406.1 DUF2840 domain-containing protein [Mesorhizobium sp. M5C.F.Ca.IN.020.14.1.1]RWG41786.1 MAG: DUF2840 domain-containing protein [Mesorhizobium sp.]RWH55752.1 MAG: DUF2840 domain-containing protein [Mesorhizobium sp.]RWI67791.1 MAG: DUF2840 domain-containing protein [Mesorhizobium sp.]
MNHRSRLPLSMQPTADGPPPCTTLVELTRHEKRIEYWIRFGRQSYEQIIDRHRRVVGFPPNSVFAFVRWAANDYGTVLSRIDIVRAIDRGEPFQTLPFVRPGGEILLKVEGWPKVARVLEHIDAIEAQRIDPSAVAGPHWRHVHHRIAAGVEPRAYTKDRHVAWLKRRSLER